MVSIENIGRAASNASCNSSGSHCEINQILQTLLESDPVIRYFYKSDTVSMSNNRLPLDIAANTMNQVTVSLSETNYAQVWSDMQHSQLLQHSC